MSRDDVTQTVAANIKAEMDRQAVSALELAKRAGLNPTGVYDILSEKSRSPKIETIAKIASALGVELTDLITGIDRSQKRAEILDLYERLPEPEQRRLLQTVRAWLQDSE